MEDDEACNGGAEGDETFTELQLARSGLGRRRRSRLPRPHLRHAEEDSGALLPDGAARAGRRGPTAPVSALRAGGDEPAGIGPGGGARAVAQGPADEGGAGGGAVGGWPDGHGARADAMWEQTCSADPHFGGTRSERKKTGTWTDAALENALNSITNDGMTIRQASKLYGIPTSSIRDHLYGRTTSRQKGMRPVLTPHEENKIIDYVFKMQDCGYPLTAAELRLKVATATQTRSTSWSARGVPGKRWLRRFRSRHPEISSRRSQGLEVARARALCPTTAKSLYANLETLYTAYTYPPTHIWNCDESGVQAGRAGGATVLARRGSGSVHLIEPDEKEHLSILSCVNADGRCIPNFYILKGSYFLQDYIANCEEGAVMDMQPNVWMTRWLFESWISHFLES